MPRPGKGIRDQQARLIRPNRSSNERGTPTPLLDHREYPGDEREGARARGRVDLGDSGAASDRDGTARDGVYSSGFNCNIATDSRDCNPSEVGIGYESIVGVGRVRFGKAGHAYVIIES